MQDSVEAEQESVTAPLPLHGLLEPARVVGELFQLACSWPLLERSTPRGDGHPVMVLPGFMGGDGSTEVLRVFLRRLGYRPLPWGLGTNTGRRAQLERLSRRFLRWSARSDQPVSLIGQSLGGVYAREMARQFPSVVRQVVSLGSPFGMQGRGGASPLVQALFERLSGQNYEDMREYIGEVDPREPLPVPSTSVYSRSDGVVHWSACRQHEDQRSENLEVVCSHVGMGVHPTVLHIIADRLVQPEGCWAPFDRGRGLRGLFVRATA